MRARSSAFVLVCVMATVAATPAIGGAAGPAPTIAPTPLASASPSEPADVAALRAKIRAARGRLPTAERVVETVVRNAATTRESTVRIGDDVRTTTASGPFQTARGTFQGQQWHQNFNGLTILDQERAGREARERRTVSLSHVTTPLVADVISDLDPKRHGTLTYVDPATSRVVRVDDVTATETTVSTSDDFRTTDGYTQAWHTHESDGIAVNDTDRRIDSVTTTGLPAAAVAIPPPRRALVAFPAGVPSVSLPCKLDDQQHFIVRVNVGGRGLDFILDTGASGIVIDESVARSLGLPSLLARSNAVNAGRYTQHETIVPEMDVGSLVMKDVAVGVVPALSFADSRLPVRAVGLLGFDFIASLALRLDYTHASVTATDYDAFKAPTGSVFPIDVRLGTQQPETDVSIDGHVGERFDLDTGGASGVMITDIFTRRYGGITHGFQALGTDMTLSGVGGSFTAKMYRIPHLLFGRVDFTDFPALVVESDRVYASGGDDGIIGPAILSQFTVTTDYADSTIFLERAAR